ncbi:DUF4870 domain-containing protein [Planktothrix sp. FACHB-1355]|uniref:DUF4870 domain-containing protein n=1 Tax=Aerosakkonema funiforme FACHB-1375 TaxID=2949571 RepID=A0A926ZMV6_9CYAN|nr:MULTISPECIES: DUF4870 domain-containing protein [Oscillatoriales]MBD2186456.1 DUF4870 domain-containing protein [Aerosakkonema funiforme FACHB-1375]MBD3562017.1 DUF4870 domain-containing protein [Planktothrix sp. FACHB-1355]
MTGNNDDRQAQMWAMWCHLASLAWIPLAIIGLPIPFANIVGPLIFWVLKKEADPFINDQGKESLNFQISMTIYGFIATIVLVFIAVIYFIVAGVAASNDGGLLILAGGVIGIGLIGLLAVIGIFQLIVVILAAVKAKGGYAYRYPFTIRLIK